MKIYKGEKLGIPYTQISDNDWVIIIGLSSILNYYEIRVFNSKNNDSQVLGTSYSLEKLDTWMRSELRKGDNPKYEDIFLHRYPEDPDDVFMKMFPKGEILPVDILDKLRELVENENPQIQKFVKNLKDWYDNIILEDWE